jgi:AcrR family transcriptional regulator
MSTEPEVRGPEAAKVPKSERGRETLRKLLDAATLEFGEKGFHEASVSGITRRAGTALGSFYTYFDSKNEIFRAVVRDLSEQVRQNASGGLAPDLGAFAKEAAALSGFLSFARTHKEIYRIIDEAEFVDAGSFRTHYETTAQRIFDRLKQGASSGELQPDLEEAHAWAVMGMNVFLGMRYSIWSESTSIEHITALANAILKRGIANPREPNTSD